MTEGISRGRPLKLPEPHAEPERTPHQHRLAWLLAVSRLHHEDPAVHRRGDFVLQLRAHGVAADQSTVSRWESARSPFPQDALLTYERILGVEPGTFAGVESLLAPEAKPRRRRAGAIRESDLDLALDRLFDAMSQGDVTGRDWYHFARDLPATNVYLRPTTWREITAPLISELARSTGSAFASRFGAATRLIRHPAVRNYVLEQIDALVNEPHAQAVSIPIALLAASPEPGAARLLEALTFADDEVTAISTAATLAGILCSNPHVMPEAKLVSLTLRLLQEVPLGAQDFAAVSLAAALPDSAFSALQERVPRKHHQRLALARATSEIVHPTMATKEARALSVAVRMNTGGLGRHEPDTMLDLLIREALFSAWRYKRQNALALLALSPYRQAAGDALRANLDKDHGDLTARTAASITYLSRPSDWDWIIDQLSTRPEDNTDVHLLNCLAYADTPMDARALDQVDVLTATRSPRVRMRGATVLGMHSAEALQKLLADPDAGVSGAAKWWLARGGAVRT